MSVLQVGHLSSAPQSAAADLHLLPDSQTLCDIHTPHAVGNLLQVGQRTRETQRTAADLHLLPDGHIRRDPIEVAPSGTHFASHTQQGNP